ncbi:glutaminase [Flavobacteriaceae bacterium UJ101]|nr:glutaminase [Flavobacteriaceae bacterium UJ101]
MEKEFFKSLYQDILHFHDEGKVASYIPELKKVNANKYGVSFQPVEGKSTTIFDGNEKFSIQSISKVFTLTMVYKELGADLWKRMGVEPSGTAFNSLVQLEYENGIPRNPFINAGAIVLADLMLDIYEDPKQELLEFVSKLVGRTIQYDLDVAQSEKATGFKNYALANLIKSYGNLHNPVDKVLDLYFHQCSIEMTCEELAKAFLLYANHGTIPHCEERILSISQTKRINSVMQMCGFYDEAGEFTFRVGLPGKSGVGGGIVAVYPSKFSIAVWSPRLNDHGNSVMGLKTLEAFTDKTGWSIF